MTPIRYLGVALVLSVLGCQGTPTVTRSGDVKDIIIGDSLSVTELLVSPGDEVRWVNKRPAPVRVIFLDALTDNQLSCKNNIGGLMTASNTAKLAMNETASACFRDPGYFRYTVRMEKADMAGERNVPGVVRVGGWGGQAGQAAGQTSDQNRGRTSGQSTDPGSDQLNQPLDKISTPKSTTSTTTSTTTTTEGTNVPTRPPQ